MTTPDNSALAEYVQSTSIYKRYAKGIAAAVAALINLVWLLTVLPAGLVPTNVAIGLALAVQVIGGVLGVVALPNSPTIRQAEEIEAYVGRHRRS
ncbi:hypothetical protein JGU71_28145 [Antrihabitans sp. YC3-6]|uniref:Holin n=1 Tax=Antrihabitans stalagmiti TaxID=2799499 RepID=A0A934U6S7_9NOCA|nr:hypothetical protein [Antrihabitans stalagmiti]MBJ8342767.1 hypothetical protein [Antrihabitans stalagmiti]